VRIAVAELVDEKSGAVSDPAFEWVSMGDISDTQFGDDDGPVRSVLPGIIDQNQPQYGPFLRIGWAQELLSWISSAISDDVSLEGSEIGQFNASPEHALLRIKPRDGAAYWFKASAEAGEPEFQVTLLLRRLFPEQLPTIIAVRTDWQGWLTKNSGLSAKQVWFFPRQSIKHIGASVATLQQASLAPHGRTASRALPAWTNLKQSCAGVRSPNPAHRAGSAYFRPRIRSGGVCVT
jgi:hypothetical protein